MIFFSQGRLYVLSFLWLLILSSCKPGHDHDKHHEIDEHQSMYVQIEKDKNMASFSFEGHGATLVGFENQPKNEPEKKKLKEAFEHFEKNIGRAIQFLPKLNCQFTKKQLDFVRQGHHYIFQGIFHCVCEQEIFGQLVFDFGIIMPELKTIRVHWPSGNQIQEQTVNARGGSIKINR